VPENQLNPKQINIDNLPDVIVLFGPPASGKGTQARMLADQLPTYEHMDLGGVLREFVNEKLGSYPDLDEEELNKLKNSTDPEIKKALAIKEIMSKGLPVPTEDLWSIIGNRLTSILASGKKLILEGLGRRIADGKIFGQIATEHNLVVSVFHIYISPDEAVKRAKTRYYIPNSSFPYPSLELAQQACTDGQMPYQRADDKDPNIVLSRYKVLYTDIFAKVMSTIQIESRGNLFIVDGHDTVEDINKHIWKYLQVFYVTKSIYK
jgi:adenylate kinase family enzyme